MLQLVTKPTRVHSNIETLIDHVYTHSKVKIKTDVVLSDISDHYGTLTTYLDKKGRNYKRWLKKEHYDEIKDKLAAVNWQPMTKLNVDAATEYLNNQIITIMDEICPVSMKTIGNKPINKWTTPGIRISLRRGTQLYRQSKKSAQKRLNTRHI